jgi:outer membrane protein OmpA-like peptidoglycan-associated protein
MSTRVVPAIGLTLLLVSASGMAEESPANRADLAGAIAAIEELEAHARAERADLLSPGHFAAGERELDLARQQRNEEWPEEDVRRHLGRAEAAFHQAIANLSAAREILGPSLAARDSALAAGAQVHAAETFARGDRYFRQAGLAVEEGDHREAVIKAADAERRFREVEQATIQEAVMGEAKRLIARADAEKAGQWAPQSLGRARELLAQAERELEDRARRGEAEALAGEAAAAASQALATADRARAAHDDPTVIEATMIEGEDQLAAIARALGLESSGSGGRTADRAAITAAIAALKGERDSLSAEIAALAKEIEQGKARERALKAELISGQERQERLKRLRTLFTPDEATLHRQGRQLILRLTGLTFLSGKSELKPGNEALLAKVVQAIRELPGASLTFEGHTDSQGDAKKNQVLSEQRAQAVRAAIEAELDLSDRLVSVVGKGEGYPVATNETESGRAENRRIDLVFDAPHLTGE